MPTRALDRQRHRLAPLVVVTVAAAVFALLLILVRVQWAPLESADHGAAARINGLIAGDATLLAVVKAVTWLGSDGVLWTVIGAAAIILAIRRRWRLAIYLLVAGAGALVLDPVLKSLVGRLRPIVAHPVAHGLGNSFPSGHSLGSMVCYGAILLVFLRYERHRRNNALIEPTLFTNRTYLSGTAVALALFGAFGGLLLCISLYGQLGEGWSPIRAGLSLTPMVVGMILGMTGSLALVSRLGRHLLHIGILLIAVGAAGLALILTGARAASAWDLVPGLFFIGAGVGASIGQLFRFILTSVTMDEVGSASGVLEAVQQLSTSLGVAVLGTIFFSAFSHHLPTYALQVTAWACLAPLAAAFVLVFRLPMQPREEPAD